MAQYYDRYENFRTNGEVKPVPGIIIPIESTDKSAKYKSGRSRMDKLSQEYYGNPYHGWLIMLANQQWGGMEFDIPDNTIIRIPFPFTSAVERYILGVKKHKELYG
jgi:hypothetical protein